MSKLSTASIRVVIPMIGLTTLVAYLLATSAASAATYDVHSCDPSWGNGTPAWAGFETAGLTAYSNCAGASPEGIVARSVAQPNATSPGFSNGYAAFDAPPGTTVDSIHADMEFSRPGCNWGAGIWATNGDLGAGHWVWGLQNGYCGADQLVWTHWDEPVNASRVMVTVICGASSCDRSSETRAAIKNVRVTISDPTPPSLGNPHGSMWADGTWLSGTQDVAFDASDGAGIRHNDIQVDGKVLRAEDHGCDYTQRAPCPNGGLSAQIDTSKITPDGPHQFVLETVDTAGNPAQVAKTINIDNSAPAAPTGLAVSGGEGWRTSNGFSVSWTNPPADGGAPITAALSSLCPAGGGSCVTSTQSGADISSLADLRVPSAGDWTLTVWLRDAAGNASTANASGPVHLRFDDGAPSVAFEPHNSADPTLVSALASDGISGIANARIEIRRHGTTTWHELASSYDGTRVTAHIDDAHLAAGPYDLEAWAVDAAGNERSSQQLADGSAAHVRLPLRVGTRILAGAAAHGRHRHARRAWRARVHAHFGRPIKLAGRLLTADRNPISGSQVLVFAREQRTGATWTPVASLTTSARGYFGYRVPAGPSRVIQFRFSGTQTIQPSIRKVSVLVPARCTIHVDHHHVLNGEYIHMRGRLVGGEIPAGGKLVTIQAFVRGHWRTFGTTRTDLSGHWRYEYRFDGTRGSQAYRLRSLVPSESGYPYDLGFSHGITVHVRGL